MNGSKDIVMVNNFHYNNFEYRELTIDIKQIGCDASDLKRKLAADSRINRVIIKGDICDRAKMRFIISALEGTRIRTLEFLDSSILSNSAFEIVTEWLKTSFVSTLKLVYCLMDADGIRVLANVLKYTHITYLDIAENYIGDKGMCYLANGLKMSKVISLLVGSNAIHCIGAKYLAEVLEDTSLIFLSLSNYLADNAMCNDIGNRGIMYLAGNLKNSNVTCLDLYAHEVSDRAAGFLAQCLKDTCVTSLCLDNNRLSNRGLRRLAQGLKDTQIVHISYHNPYKCNFMPSTESIINEAISKNQKAANKFKDSFTKLVAQNTETYDLEFIIPNEIQDLDIKEYLDLIRNINDTPNVKGHVFARIKENECLNYPQIIQKTNEFVRTVLKKFNTFINNKLPDLVNSVGDYDYVDLLKQFDDLKYYDIVQNLLLHRQLFYVDENQEILHPYVYKTLHKYNMTLYNEQLEPNKKGEIITYYQNHPEINGAQEIVNLLKTNSL